MSNVIIYLAKKQSMFKAWLFALTAMNSNKMFWFWCSVFACQQMISVSIEMLFWGETFYHWIDPLFTGLCCGLYIHYQSELGKTLLSIILNGESNG